jgi:hypothetical protein
MRSILTLFTGCCRALRECPGRPGGGRLASFIRGCLGALAAAACSHCKCLLWPGRQLCVAGITLHGPGWSSCHAGLVLLQDSCHCEVNAPNALDIKIPPENCLE